MKKYMLFMTNGKKMRFIKDFNTLQEAIKIGSICPFVQEFKIFNGQGKQVSRFSSLGVTYSTWKLLGYVPDCILSEN